MPLRVTSYVHMIIVPGGCPGCTEVVPMDDDGPLTKLAYGEFLAAKMEAVAALAQEVADMARSTDFLLHERDDFWRRITMMDYDLRGMKKHMGC